MEFLCRFASKFKTDFYSVIAIFPADITLPRIRVRSVCFKAKMDAISKYLF